MRQQLCVLATAVDEQWEEFYRVKDVHAFIHPALTEYFLSVLGGDKEQSVEIVYAEFSHIHRTSQSGHDTASRGKKSSSKEQR